MTPSGTEFSRARQKLRRHIIERENAASFNQVGGGIGILIGHEEILKHLPERKLKKEWEYLYRVSIKDPKTQKAKTMELYDKDLKRVAVIRHPKAPRPSDKLKPLEVPKPRNSKSELKGNGNSSG